MLPNPKIIKARRTYNKLVANEMMEDFALRYTAKRARKWSLHRVSMTALAVVSCLILEAVGGAITLNYGFVNSAWAILTVTFILFFTGLPICYYSAKYGVDIDLLSRGAGFGYIGSSITSLVYASFTFIFFAFEAAIMAMALQILTGLPLATAYIVSALMVLPLVINGFTYITRFQVWTQPIWITLQLLPLFFVFSHPDVELSGWLNFTGKAGEVGSSFNLLLFGSASAVLLAFVAQIAEQVDFLRFLPEKTQKNKYKWWLALIAGGPGWILFGALKLFLGSFLAYFAVKQGMAIDLADDPAHMYQLAYSYVFDNPNISMIVACLFVVISQLRINVANAYAGSLAWSNFFSRITHNHPGRVVWLVFNVVIALLLMELGIYQTIVSMLSIYSVIVLAWLGSIVADLIINKPLGLSPKEIEFKRSHLYDINPVGVVSMLLASCVGFTAHMSWYGDTIKALASFIAFFLPFISAPFIAWLTKSKFYLVKSNNNKVSTGTVCHICDNEFDPEDMTFCPAYGNAICSLCCGLDVRCGDQCRSAATIAKQLHRFFNRFLSTDTIKAMTTPLMQFIVVTLSLSSIAAGVLYLIYQQAPMDDPALKQVFFSTLMTLFFLLIIIIGVVSWLFILARNSNQHALQELRSQSDVLAKEIIAHHKTASALQAAKEIAESSSLAKSRYLAGFSHELRTPLNVILGYAQLLMREQALPAQQREAIAIMKRNGEHLSELIERLLDISQIEAGRMTLQCEEFNLKIILQQIVDMFQMQASDKQLKFHYIISPNLPEYVLADRQRLRQILINLVSNAIKYTMQGSVTFKVTYQNEMVDFSVIDTGMGISKTDQALIFKPFEQIRSRQTQKIEGTGLGLTISHLIAKLMGGKISVKSCIGQGSTFNFRLALSETHNRLQATEITQGQIVAYSGARKTVLVVDDDVNQHALISDLLQSIGFQVLLAGNAQQGFRQLQERDVDLILLDVQMPEMDGWQMLEKLREQNYTMPILMVSANTQYVEHSLQPEDLYTGYITKPLDFDALFDKIGQCLELHWQYINIASSDTEFGVGIQSRGVTSSEHYQSLIALAEIGFLTGFKERFIEIGEQYQYPIGVASQVKKYLKECNFPKIIKFLSELSHEK